MKCLRFLILNPSVCIVALGSTDPLTGMSTRDISWGIRAAVPLAGADCLGIQEGSASWSPKGFSRPVMR